MSEQTTDVTTTMTSELRPERRRLTAKAVAGWAEHLPEDAIITAINEERGYPGNSDIGTVGLRATWQEARA